MNRRLLILGAGQFGKMAEEIACAMAEAAGCFEQIDFLDDSCPAAAGRLKDYRKQAAHYVYAVAAVDAPGLRLAWIGRLREAGYRIPVLVHPRASVSPSARLMEGTIVEEGAFVGDGCIVSTGCIISVGAVIGRGSFIDDVCHISRGATVEAGSVVMAGTCTKCGEAVRNGVWRLSGKRAETGVQSGSQKESCCHAGGQRLAKANEAQLGRKPGVFRERRMSGI